VDLVGDHGDLSGLGIDAVDSRLGFALTPEPLVVASDAVVGIGEPDAAVLVYRQVVGRVQPLPLIAFGDDGHRPVVLVTNHSAAAVRAGGRERSSPEQRPETPDGPSSSRSTLQTWLCLSSQVHTLRDCTRLAQ